MKFWTAWRSSKKKPEEPSNSGWCATYRVPLPPHLKTEEYPIQVLNESLTQDSSEYYLPIPAFLEPGSEQGQDKEFLPLPPIICRQWALQEKPYVEKPQATLALIGLGLKMKKIGMRLSRKLSDRDCRSNPQK